jgi:hypothetical protein
MHIPPDEVPGDPSPALPARRSLTRRDALGTIAAAGVAGVVTSAASAAAARAPALEALDLDDPKVNLGALLKILASTDPRETVISFSAGRVYACISERSPIPLFGTHSIAVARARARPDGSFLLRQHIVGFRTHFNSEAFIEQFVNPITDEKLDLPLTDYHVNDSDYRLDGTFARVQSATVQMNQAGPRPWSQADGIVALSDDALTTAPGLHQPKVDVVTRFAFAHDLARPRVRSAPSWFSFSAVDPFRPWLRMTEPGFQLWHVYGRKVRGPSDLPAYIRQVADSQFPGLFDLPQFLPSDA